MKNKTLRNIISIILIIFAFTGRIFGEDENENIKILNEIYEHTLRDSGGNYSIDLTFTNDFRYEFDFNQEGTYWHNEGSYHIKNNFLELAPKVCKERKNHTRSISCKQTFGFGKCKIVDNFDNPFVDKFLSCKSDSNPNAFHLTGLPNEYKFPLFKLPTKPGKLISYQKIPLLLLKIKGITLANVKIREKPDIKSASIKYYLDSEHNKYLDYLPKDSEIFLIGRTTSLSQIQNWNNYWYLVIVNENHYVWIYGEFIKPIN